MLFGEIETLPPVPFLAELREEVLKHSLKRMPKWKFRLASDLILQLQPKPTVLPSETAMARGIKPKLHLFEGVMSEGVAGDALKRLPQRPAPPWWQIRFELYSDSPDADWVFKRASGCWQSNADRAGITTIVQRITTAFRNGFLTASVPAEMLSHHCMICGKVLTDPASMARWIGPECAGTSMLHVPFVITNLSTRNN